MKVKRSRHYERRDISPSTPHHGITGLCLTAVTLLFVVGAGAVSVLGFENLQGAREAGQTSSSEASKENPRYTQIAVSSPAPILKDGYQADSSAGSAEEPGVTDTAEAPSGTQEETSSQAASSEVSAPAAPASSENTQPTQGTVSDYDFSDAVFIGDSRTQALQTYGVMKKTTYYAGKGLMVDTVSTKPVIELNGNRVTVMQALSQKQIKRVYIMLGVNELGWSSSQKFIDTYGAAVDQIKKLQPNAEIYVQSILPVSAKKSAGDAIYNNTKINSYNQLIEAMAKEKGVHYLTVNSALMGADGALPPDASTDGVHPNKDYCAKWVEYLRSSLS